MKNKMQCLHEWEEDERFASGGVIMLFGKIGDIKRETRMICKKCGEVKYDNF